MQPRLSLQISDSFMADALPLEAPVLRVILGTRPTKQSEAGLLRFI